MRKAAKNYYTNLFRLMSSIRTTDQEGNKLDFCDGLEMTCNIIKSQIKSGNKLIFIGNGASAAMSSHMSTDFWKNGGMKAIAFNDSSLLTCISNDLGYEYVFEKSIEMFGDKGDVLFAISSSGKSENILKGVKTAHSKECKVITLSGFRNDNLLSSLGNLNFYISSQDYGPVEIIHQSICHCILDILIEGDKWTNTE